MKDHTHNHTPRATRYALTIGWLYPKLMSTYGDRGNIIVLTKRCEWRGIDVEVVPIDQTTTDQKLVTIDLFFAGGAQDREQGIVMKDLKKGKAKILKDSIANNTPALFVCGAPQLMGKWYEPAEGERIEGVGVFDITTKHPGQNEPRLIGNIIAKINWTSLMSRGAGSLPPRGWEYIVGFENHGGRTSLGKSVKPLAKVIVGHGNNGIDKTEGMVYKNAIGTYLHGPLLPKNPHIADWIIQKALEVKYKQEIQLKELEDSLEYQAQKAIAKQLGVQL